MTVEVAGEQNGLMTRGDIYRQSLQVFLRPVWNELYDDETVTEVMINGHDQIYVERKGTIERLPASRCFSSPEALQAAVNNIAEYVERRLDRLHHSMDARLPEPEKFRVHVIMPPCSRNGIVVTIRKFSRRRFVLQDLVDQGSLSPAAAEFLQMSVRLHRNLIISGGTGSGKTSLLNALSTCIPEEERIIVIEDSSELRLAQPHTIYLEARPAEPDGRGQVSIRDLFVDSLRMRPDRIVVGEVRRGEALDLIQSMLSGHDGSLSTVHASSPSLALTRLETLSMMSDVNMPVHVARTQVASAVHLVVQISRIKGSGAERGGRFVTEISEIRGLQQNDRYEVVPLFRRMLTAAGGRALQPTGARCQFTDLAMQQGVLDQLNYCREVFEKKPE